MDYHDLQKTRVTDLREMVKTNLPDIEGVTGLKKDALIDMLATHMKIEKPHKHVAFGLGKRAIRADIKDLKVKRAAALEAHDPIELKSLRRKIHRHKRRLRRLLQKS